ncbi:MAG TPA: hypothetical protein VLA52_15895, partial [Thermohalobaculum sp.]|nr:hypothetical protein [Thermohalobaculum sp.]
MRTILKALLLFAAAPALAADPVAPSEFREYAEGHTLYFELDGEPFGSESFEPGGKTVWRYERDGNCLEGVWRPYGAQICFYYGGGSEEILCWRLLRDEQGLMVRLLGDGPDAG